MKKPKTRTRRGEKMVVLEDGSLQLIPSQSLAATLASTDNAMREEDSAKTAARLDAIREKQDSLSTGDSVPGDKRAI